MRRSFTGTWSRSGIETRRNRSSTVFKNPKAPFFAARDEGRVIDLGRWRPLVEEKSRRYAPLILEAAGGLLVPVAGKNADGGYRQEERRQGARSAARAGLGTINHTLLSLEALSARGTRARWGLFFSMRRKRRRP